MHYKNGRAAKIGDRILTKDWQGTPIAGIVVHANAQSTTCNLYVHPLQPNKMQTVTASECLHVDDVLGEKKPA